MTLKMPPSVHHLLQRLNRHGYEAYIVGGCVRDALLGKTPQDWDICTSALPQQVIACFPEYPCREVGVRFGTVVLALEGEHYEITTFRSDGKYTDGRRPDSVSFSTSLQEDLLRRDFTINAMAYSPAAGLVDLFGGRQDIQNRLIRCVGNPDERLQEDSLRILRGLRFAAKTGFSFEESTRLALFRNAALLAHVSAERIREEFVQILLGDFSVLDTYREILAVFLPEIRPMFEFEQNNPHHIFTVWQHTVESVAQAPQDKVIRLALFFHDIGKPSCYTFDGCGHFYGHGLVGKDIARNAINRLKFDNETKHEVLKLIEYHDAGIQPTAKSIRRWLNRLGPESLFRLLWVKRCDVLAQAPGYIPERIEALEEISALAQKIIADNSCFSLQNLAVNGTDIIQLGVVPGPQVGAILRYLLNLVLEGAENRREPLLKKAADYLAAVGKQATEL